MDDNIAGGMEVNECADVIMRGFDKGKPEIPVGEGIEMKALLLKRFFPKLLFKMAERTRQLGVLGFFNWVFSLWLNAQACPQACRAQAMMGFCYPPGGDS